MRTLRLILIFLSILLAAFFGGLFFLVGTGPGTRWLMTQVASHAPGTLSIGQIDGTLLGRLTLHQINYRQEQTVFSIDKIVLQWRSARLLISEVYLETIKIDRLRIVLPSRDGTQTTPPASLPVIRIPFNIAVEKAVVDGITISGKKETRIDQVSFSGRASPSEIRIDELKVAALAYAVVLKGRVVPKDAYPFDATVHWSAKLQNAQGENLKGDATIKGDLKQVHVVHRLTEPMPVETEGVLEIKKVEGNLAGITIRSLRSSALGGKIDVTGEASWSPHPAWELTLTGSSLNPGALRPDLDGVLSFEMHTKGRTGEQGLFATFQIERMTGTMRDHTVTAAGGLDIEGETVRIDRLSLNTGTARLTASGVVSPHWDLVWSLNAPDLSHLLPEAAGRFIGKGRLKSERKLPTGSADIEGNGLVWKDARIDSIKLRFLIDPEDRVESYIFLNAKGLRKSGQTLDSIELNGKGKRTAHRIQTDLKAGKHRLALLMEGKIEQAGWDGKLLRTIMSEEEFGQWNLVRPVAILIKADSAEAGEGCWKHEKATVCAKGRWGKTRGWETSGHAERIPLSLIKPWIPDGVSLSGSVNGSWEASSTDSAFVSKTRWTPSQGKIEYRSPEGNHLTIGYREGHFQATIENKSLQTETELTLTGQGRLRVNLKLSPFDLGEDWKQSGLEGSVHAEFSQLGLIAAFAPAVEKTEGRIRLDLTIGGTPEKPRINGTAALEQGSARVPALGIEIEQLHITASGHKESIAIEGTARSGPGSLTIKGTVILDAGQGWQTRLAIKGDRFQSVDLPDVKLFASPNLILVIQHRRIDLTGEVLIPEANIKVRELPKQTATVSEDVVIVKSSDGKGGPAQTPWEIHTKVTILLGQKVKFSGFGLTGRVLGQLMVTEGPDRVATGEGELHIADGRYEAYGQKLEIESGRLIFTGPVDDPGIDVRATRKIDMITAGIRVAGTLKRPDITLFSNPPMDQENILSYLLFGHPFSQTTQSQGSGIMNEVRSGSTESFGKASVGVGHYLSPRLYVGYGIGLFDSANTIRMRYQISKTLALRTESSQLQTGIDLLFIKEFK